jgi:hypothetical protein
MDVGLGRGLLWISTSSLLIQRASFAALELAIYSASVLEVATMFYFADFQETAPP